jgi:hypothetical protein
MKAEKELRRRLLDLTELAYERELSHELAELEAEFGRWRSGETNAFDVSQAIHEFHQVVARDLFSRYRPENAEIVVAQAIIRGIISNDEAGLAVMQHLAGHMRTLE